PVASAQVTGPTLDPTMFSGVWRDPCLQSDAHAPYLTNFPGVNMPSRDAAREAGAVFAASGNVAQQRGRFAYVVEAAMNMLLREGQLLRVEWGRHTRYGLLREFTPSVENPEDIPWEAEFEWVGETATQPKPNPRKRMDAVAVSRGLEAKHQELETMFFGSGLPNPELPFLGALFLGRQFVTMVQQQIRRIGTLVIEALDLLGQIIDLAFSPSDVLATLRSTL